MKTKWILGAPMVLSGALFIAGCNNAADTNGGTNGGSNSAAVIPVAPGPVATVNGIGIDREELHQFLEATGGPQALNSLIEIQLVNQEAAKQGVAVTDANVEAALQERRSQNPAIAKQIDDLTKAGGPRAEAFKRQIRYQLTLDNLLTKNIKVEPAALQKWFTAQKARYGTEAQVKIGVLVASSKARADVMAQQLKAKTKTFAQLVGEQQKAKDPLADQNLIETPDFLPVSRMPENMKGVVAKMKNGDTSPSMMITPGMFGMIRMVQKQEAKTPTLDQIRFAAERDYKLEQVARQAVAKRLPKTTFDQALLAEQKTVADQNMQRGDFSAPPPTRSQLVQSLNSKSVQDLRDRSKKEAKVESSDATYKEVIDSYKPAVPIPAAGAPAGNAASPPPNSATPVKPATP